MVIAHDLYLILVRFCITFFQRLLLLEAHVVAFKLLKYCFLKTENMAVYSGLIKGFKCIFNFQIQIYFGGENMT